jgi:hypothetical protein
LFTIKLNSEKTKTAIATIIIKKQRKKREKNQNRLGVWLSSSGSVRFSLQKSPPPLHPKQPNRKHQQKQKYKQWT